MYWGDYMKIKEYMPLDCIRTNILSNYPYNIYEIIPIKFKDTDKQRAVYKFESSDGPKCLKKVYFDEANLLFVYSVIQWFYSNGINVPKILPTKCGGRYVRFNDDLFIVTDWIEGRKCDYDNDYDVCKAAENLGKMHRLSYDFRPISGSCIKKDETDWHKVFSRRHHQLLQFSNTAFALKDEFSKIYLSCFDCYSERAAHAVTILNKIDNEKFTYPAEKLNTICHLDYVNKNLIFTYTGDLYVIDFDKSKIDMPIHDLGTFLKRILKRTNTSWNFQILTMSINSYEKERKLSLEELLGLFVFLEFPQKYWKISRDYFSNVKECNKKLFVSMLKQVSEQKDEHNIFCQEFMSLIEERYGINL